MVGLLRGFLGGLIAAATMAGGLRAIGRGEKLPVEGLGERLMEWGLSLAGVGARAAMVGLKGGSKAASCPPKGSMHHLAKCPVCGKRGHEHEPA
jgi:hypothetical protein